MREDVAGERSIRSTEAVRQGDCIVKIPARCIITAETVTRYAWGRSLAQRWRGRWSDHVALSVFLLGQVVEPDPWWAPYVWLLPDRYAHLPLFFTQEELGYLAGSTIPRVTERRRRAFHEEFAQIAALEPMIGRLGIGFYWRARATVLSRSFALQAKAESKQALVPMADLFNHSIPPQIKWRFADSGQSFSMTCASAASAGQQLHDSYGRKSNTRLLQNYGFVLSGNADDEGVVWLSPHTCDPRLEERAKEFGPIENGARGFRLPSTVNSGASVISFLRVKFARAEEVEAALTCGSAPVPFLSARNERAALDELRNACVDALGRYETTIAADDELLAGPLTSNARNCITVRRGEKAALQKWREFAEKAIAEIA